MSSINFTGHFAFNTPLTLKQVMIVNTFCEKQHDDKKYPGYYCDWRVTQNGKYLIHNGSEKFPNYKEWLEYLCNNYFVKWGALLNGIMHWIWEGEEHGQLSVIDNRVTDVNHSVKYEEPDDLHDMDYDGLDEK